MKKELLFDVIVNIVTLVIIIFLVIFKFTLLLFAFISFFFVYNYPRYISKVTKCPKCGSNVIWDWKNYSHRKVLYCKNCKEYFYPSLGKAVSLFSTIPLSWIISTTITGYIFMNYNSTILIFFVLSSVPFGMYLIGFFSKQERLWENHPKTFSFLFSFSLIFLIYFFFILGLLIVTKGSINLNLYSIIFIILLGSGLSFLIAFLAMFITSITKLGRKGNKGPLIKASEL